MTVSRLLAVLSTVLALAAGPAAQAAKSPTEQTSVVPIIGQALSPSALATDVRRLADEIGGRLSGSPAMARAVDWALAAFRDAGIEPHTETYTQTLTWTEGRTRLEVHNHPEWTVSLVANGWSQPTPAGGIDARVVPVGFGTEEDFAAVADHTAGAILIVDSKIIQTWEDLDYEYDRVGPIVKRAQQSGARAILWVGARARQLLYRHSDAVSGELSPLPEATLAREDGERLVRLAASVSRPLTVHFTMPNVVGGPVKDRNVVGEIRGRERSDEVVVLAAHLDSWDLGTGALDNGCNAALVIAAARAIHDAGLVPRSTLRFVLFSGEEEGNLGSRAYVTRHRGELDRTRAMLVIDGGSGRVSGFKVAGREDVARALEATLAPLGALDATRTSLGGGVGNDNFDFMLEGVPTLVADLAAANFIENYHAASDTFDKVDFAELARNVAIMAVASYAIADRSEPLAPRLDRAAIEALLEAHGFDKQMQLEGYWDAWAAGTRGRER